LGDGCQIAGLSDLCDHRLVYAFHVALDLGERHRLGGVSAEGELAVHRRLHGIETAGEHPIQEICPHLELYVGGLVGGVCATHGGAVAEAEMELQSEVRQREVEDHLATEGDLLQGVVVQQPVHERVQDALHCRPDFGGPGVQRATGGGRRGGGFPLRRRGRAPPFLLEIGHRWALALLQLRQQFRAGLGPGRRPVEVFQHLGVQEAVRRFASAHALEILRDDPPLVDRDLRGIAADVRRGDHVGEGQQRIVGRGWLHGENVQGGAAEMLRAQRLEEGVLIDEGRPGGVDEEASRPHLCELPLADDPGRVVGDRRV
jgi:hypothetical protein